MKTTTIKAVDEFVKLVGGKSWVKTKQACRGKWAGTYDYGFIIDGKMDMWVSNDMSRFEENVVEWCEGIHSFNAHKIQYLDKIRELVNRDNLRATAEGLFPVKVLDIGVISPESSDCCHFFRPYVFLEVNGEQYKFTESGLGEVFFRSGIDKWLAKAEKPLWTAGGISKPNFVFGGIRFDSNYGGYRIR